MKTEDAISYFGSRYAIALALDIAPPSVYRWGDVVPDLRQLQLERLTRGVLKANAHLKFKPLPIIHKKKKGKKQPAPVEAVAIAPEITAKPEAPPPQPGWWKSDSGIMARAVELGVAPLPGETYHALKSRLLALSEPPPETKMSR
jgi:hypothetical protein